MSDYPSMKIPHYDTGTIPSTKPFSDDTSINTGMFRVFFLARHPADQFLPDDLVRWWLE